MHKYSEAETQFIHDHYQGIGNIELASKFNERFNLNLSPGQLASFKGNRHWNSGVTNYFKKGQIPFNKGMRHKPYPGSIKTMFKKGHPPIQHRDIKSTRIDSEGYLYFKVAEPSTWVPYHRYLWEQSHGQPVPKGHVVIFADGNKQNFHLGNLVLVSRGELAILNKSDGIYQDTDLTKTNLNVIRVNQLIRKKQVGDKR